MGNGGEQHLVAPKSSFFKGRIFVFREEYSFYAKTHEYRREQSDLDVEGVAGSGHEALGLLVEGEEGCGERLAESLDYNHTPSLRHLPGNQAVTG